jgi:hypothetical protein
MALFALCGSSGRSNMGTMVSLKGPCLRVTARTVKWTVIDRITGAVTVLATKRGPNRWNPKTDDEHESSE